MRITTPWFDLARHDDPAPQPEPAPEPTPTPDPEPDPAPEPEPAPEKDWKAEAEKWKALSRRHETNAKSNAEKAKKLDEIEEANKTEAEKLAAAKEAAEKKAQAAITRAVKAEVKALAATDFADPTDAEAAINPNDFVDANGDIDTDGIQAKLTGILEAKPHWRKQSTASVPPKLKPDPGQGSRPTPAATNFREADGATFAAEMAKYGLKTRSS